MFDCTQVGSVCQVVVLSSEKCSIPTSLWPQIFMVSCLLIRTTAPELYHSLAETDTFGKALSMLSCRDYHMRQPIQVGVVQSRLNQSFILELKKE